MTPTQDRFAAALTAIAQDYAEQLASAGQSLDDVGGVERLAHLVRLVLPRPSRLPERVGPVYATGQLTRLLPGPAAAAITDEAVRDRRRNGRLIGFKTADGRWAWPAWQFAAEPGRLVPREDVLALWRLLPVDVAGDLALVAWLRGAHRGLDGATPLEWLDAHGLDERLRGAASRYAARLVA